MKWNYGKIIKIPTGSAAGQIPGLNSLFCLVQVCLIVSVRGKTPIPMDPWGYSHHTRGSLNSSGWSLCRWKVPLMDKGMHDMRFWRERKAAWFVTDKLHPSATQSGSEFVHLWSHIQWPERGGEGFQPPFLSRLSAFRRGQLSPWVGTGHMAPVWAVQSKDHGQTWSASHGQSSV